jgi:hypothetical protein
MGSRRPRLLSVVVGHFTDPEGTLIGVAGVA